MNDKDICKQFHDASTLADELEARIDELQKQLNDIDAQQSALERKWLATHKCSCGLMDMPCEHEA